MGEPFGLKVERTVLRIQLGPLEAALEREGAARVS